MTGEWGAAVRRLVLAGAILLVLGLWQGRPFVFLLVGALAYLLWNLFNLYRLDRWITDPAEGNPPDVPGIWGHVIYSIAAIQRKSRKQKKRMAKLLVEFRKSTEAMPDAAVVLDKQDQISWFNSAATRLLGLASGRDLGQRIDNLLRAPGFRNYLQNRDFDQPLLMASPVRDDVLLSARIIPYGKGQRLLLARDITERARLERMRTDFVANASHELRTPITVLTGYLESMHHDPELAAQWQIPVEEMHRQAQRMDRLVTDLLELSRLEAADTQIKAVPIDMETLLHDVLRDVSNLRDHMPEMSVSIASNAMLLGEPSGLRSVCQNLLSNAVRYTPADGRIEIGWRADANGGQLWVDDTGAGIEAEHVDRITERFYRGDAGRSRDSGGTGLGLAIVKHVLELHDASLEIASEPGRGSTFTCRFPSGRIASSTNA